jgi:hypothetical protein
MSDDVPAAKRGGRPPKPSQERKTELISFRVTQVEADAIYCGALQRGQTVGDYLLERAGFRMDTTQNPFRRDTRGATLRGNR